MVKRPLVLIIVMLFLAAVCMGVGTCKNDKQQTEKSVSKETEHIAVKKSIAKTVEKSTTLPKNINAKYLLQDPTMSNTYKNSKIPDNVIIDPIIKGTYYDYNDANAYVLTGYRYPDDPEIQLLLVIDRYFTAENINKNTAANTFSEMASVWDSKTSADLFSTNPVIISSIAPSLRTPDETTSLRFAKISGKGTTSIVGYNQWWYSRNEDVTAPDGTEYHMIVDSDIVLNSNQNWGFYPTSDTTLDVGTATLHELGHTVGLGDTYLDPVYKYDTAQIMGYYVETQHDLGDGDVTGIKKLWGN